MSTVSDELGDKRDAVNGMFRKALDDQGLRTESVPKAFKEGMGGRVIKGEGVFDVSEHNRTVIGNAQEGGALPPVKE